MKMANIMAIAVLTLLLGACASKTPGLAAPTAIPTVVAGGTIAAKGRLEPVRYTDIALNASGLISEVLVKEGDEVTAGQVIARLKSNDAQTLETAQAQALKELTDSYDTVRQAQFQLDHFDVPSDFTNMTPEQAVQITLEKLNSARAAYDPFKYNAVNNHNGKELKKALDDAWAKYDRTVQWMQLDSSLKSAQARLVRAQKDYAGLQDPTNSEATAGIRAALANAEVRAPFAGTVTTLKLKAGEYAAAGKTVMTVADLSGWVVKTTDLTEIDVVGVKAGQPATIKLDAIPGTELKGQVLSIGKTYSEKQGDIIYEVTILLNESRPEMRWGMTAEVQFPR